MAIRAGLADVAGTLRVPYRHSGTFYRPNLVRQVRIDPLSELRSFIEQERARLERLKYKTRTQ